MGQHDHIKGDWIDSSGSKNQVHFKKTWGEHAFSRDEIGRLLNGGKIAFRYGAGMICGHLQYRRTKEGKRYFGFCPDFDENYIENPLYDPSEGSKFIDDMRKEHLVNLFMRTYYYSKLINADGSKVESEYIDDESRQKQGIDVIFSRDQKRYVVDEKAQIDYINEDRPLSTFALELLNSSSGKIGWFINEELETEYYMFIWPHADGRLKRMEDIEYAQYALVERQRLKREIEGRYLSMESLQKYALRLSKGGLKADDRDNRSYYKRAPFDNDAYLVFTKGRSEGKEGKAEKPVNLVVRKSLIDKVAEEKGVLKRNDMSNGGIM